MRRGARRALLAATGAIALGAVGCGSDDFENEPRPPSPIELTAKVDDRRVVVSPTEIDGDPIGAGLANVTVQNFTDEETQLAFSGPSEATSDPILAGTVLNFKLQLEEGTYTVTADAARRDMELEVGQERKSAQNKLLLP